MESSRNGDCNTVGSGKVLSRARGPGDAGASGDEASGQARWFERLLSELHFELWIGDAAKIRTKRVRKQKTDRQDAQLILQLLLEDRFPKIWVPAQKIETCGNCCGTGTAWCRRARES